MSWRVIRSSSSGGSPGRISARRTLPPPGALAPQAGVRLGTVSEVPTPWLCLQDDIRRDGADPASVRRVTDGTMAQNAARLRDGTLDAVQVFQPYAEDLLASGAGHLWYAAAERGLTAYTTLVTRRAVLASRAGRTAGDGARHGPDAALGQGHPGGRDPASAGRHFP